MRPNTSTARATGHRTRHDVRLALPLLEDSQCRMIHRARGAADTTRTPVTKDPQWVQHQHFKLFSNVDMRVNTRTPFHRRSTQNSSHYFQRKHLNPVSICNSIHCLNLRQPQGCQTRPDQNRVRQNVLLPARHHATLDNSSRHSFASRTSCCSRDTGSANNARHANTDYIRSS